jgi:long-chain acyl-CoA synthetase
MAGLGLPPGQEPEVVTYLQLEERSNQLAHLFRSRGLKRGDTIAMFMSNSARFHEVAWAAQRAGLRFVCCSSKLAVSELQYIVEDSGSRIVIASPDLNVVARQLAARIHWRTDMDFLMVSDPDPELPYKSLEAERTKFPKTPIADQSAGQPMPYSSGKQRAN